MRTVVVSGVLAIALCARVASAQETGGSIGGGSWDDEPSSDTSSYSSGDTSSYSSGDTSYSSSGSSGSSDNQTMGPAGAFTILGLTVIVLFGVCVVVPRIADPRRRARIAAAPRMEPGGEVDVTVLYFGLDARVRPYVQRELDRIARVADTRSPEGLARMLGEVALMLRRVRDTWVYGGAINEAMGPRGSMQATFQRHVADARATFAHELIRAADGKLTTAPAPHLTPRTEEGAGLVVVTLVIAARQELFTVTKIGNGDELRAALEVLSALTARTVVAVEVVWTPADPDDRMSSVELEARFEGRMFPIAGAMVGKVICAYCGGPFPRELMSCPHCGARAGDARAAG